MHFSLFSDRASAELPFRWSHIFRFVVSCTLYRFKGRKQREISMTTTIESQQQRLQRRGRLSLHYAIFLVALVILSILNHGLARWWYDNPSTRTTFVASEKQFDDYFWLLTSDSVVLPYRTAPNNNNDSTSRTWSCLTNNKNSTGCTHTPDHDKPTNQEGLPKPLLSCMKPNAEGTWNLVKQQQQGMIPRPISLPVFNLGMPKIGSTTLFEFFKCSGIPANHGENGMCFKNAHMEGKPVVQTCNIDNSQAWLQLDINWPHRNACHYPQMSELEQIHEEEPNATFILNFRPFHDWYTSLINWRVHNVNNGTFMSDRLKDCDLPGLPKGKGNETELQEWLCNHVHNVRRFVQEHSSHALIELDLYDTTTSSEVMAELFGSNASCWGKANTNKRKKRKRKHLSNSTMG